MENPENTMVQEYTNKYEYMKVRFVRVINQLTIFIIFFNAKSLQTLCESVRLNL